MARERFRGRKRDLLFEINSEAVKTKWPEVFKDLKTPHYICEHCGWVSDQKEMFQIDHVWPCQTGGTNNFWVSSLRLYEAIQTGDTQALYQHGVNAQVLCRGCNASKQDEQFPRRSQKAHAIQYSELDRNPDHLYSGPPKLSDF